MVSLVKLDSVGRRLLVETLALLVVLLGVLGATVVARRTAWAEERVAERGEATADLFARAAHGHVAAADAAALKGFVARAMKDADVRYLAFFDATGTSLTAGEDSPREPLSDADLLRFERPFEDGTGRKLGWMTLLYSRESALEEARNERRDVVGGVLALLVLFSVGLTLLVRRTLQPIRELTRQTREVVETGDLRKEVRVEAHGEVGELAEAIQQMLGQWRSALTNLRASSQLLDTSVHALTSATEEQTQTITRQAAALQEAQVTAQEIRQTSLMAAQKAEAVLQAIGRADQVSLAGEQAVEESRQGLAEIQTQVLLMARRVEQLGDRTKQIAAITETVKGLADQSNMLALNAAIEAVRSGEAGKGFSVVAREIRSLADQSIDATGRVRDILEDIGGAVAEVVRITQEGAMRIATGLEQVNSSGESLRELSVIVKENSGAARQIAAAVEQQNAGIAQISTAVQQLSAMMDDTVKRLESTSMASTTIATVSEQAAAVVRDYQV